MHIGFIGLGNMGGELARHLLAAGHRPATHAVIAISGGFEFSRPLLDSPENHVAAILCNEASIKWTR